MRHERPRTRQGLENFGRVRPGPKACRKQKQQGSGSGIKVIFLVYLVGYLVDSGHLRKSCYLLLCRVECTEEDSPRGRLSGAFIIGSRPQ